MKFAVGVILSAYGVFGLTEGLGEAMPLGLLLAAAALAGSLLAVKPPRRRAPGGP